MKQVIIGFLIFLAVVGMACIQKHFSMVRSDREATSEFWKANEALDKTLKLPRGM